MRHALNREDVSRRLGSGAASAVTAIERCVHCGFCLATCPTYAEQAHESDSPRGRIVLMKAVLENELELEEALPHIDGCLGCLACESSCPSGVAYGELLTPFRAYVEAERPPDRRRERLRSALLGTLESPKRLRWLARLGAVARPGASLLPESLRTALDLLPRSALRGSRLPERVEASGQRRGRVLLFPGCVQQVFEPDVHSATLEVLAHCGVEAVVAHRSVCCGALAAHSGELERARVLARENLRSLDTHYDLDSFDAVLVNVAGCGSGFAEYPAWLAEDAQLEAARRIADHVVDVSVYLDQLGVPAPAELRTPLRATVQDACHLRHAQGVSASPRRLLAKIPGLEIVEAAEPDVCCGSAGLFNLEHPEMARRLGRRKALKLAAAEPDLVVTGNIGCLLQLRRHLEQLQRLSVGHARGGSLRSEAGRSRGSNEAADSDPLRRLDIETALAEREPAEEPGPVHAEAPPRVAHLMQVLRDAYRGDLGG